MCGMVILLQVVKVCDFGVARLKPTSLNAAEKSNCFAAEMTAETGTYRWMSPEVRSLQINNILQLRVFEAMKVINALEPSWIAIWLFSRSLTILMHNLRTW